MEIEQNEKELEEGLYIVATPIGNLEDITLRALRVLNGVDIIMCDDTRRTLKLLSKYNIKKKLISCNGYNEKNISEKMEIFFSGKRIAYVSDGGTPGISDPGELIVNKAYELGIRVIPIPGPCAMVSVLSISGFVKKDIHFFGFLPIKEGKRRKYIEKMLGIEGIVVIYESPFRVKKLLNACFEILGDKRIIIGRELTKIFEEVKRDSLYNIVNNLENLKEKGEYVICIEL